MSRVVIISRSFPGYHPRAGEPTFFVEKFFAALALTQPSFEFPKNFTFSMREYLECKEPKFTTIRAGGRWKAGDQFSPRCWSAKPRRSHQMILGPDVTIVKVWNIEMIELLKGLIITYPSTRDPGFDSLVDWGEAAKNDGLQLEDFRNWFVCDPKFIRNHNSFKGQILTWSPAIQY